MELLDAAGIAALMAVIGMIFQIRAANREARNNAESVARWRESVECRLADSASPRWQERVDCRLERHEELINELKIKEIK